MKYLTLYKIALVFIIDSFIIKCVKTIQNFRTNADLCDSDTEISLDANGEGSSLTIYLKPQEKMNICTLKVKAPNTHIINVQFIDIPSDNGDNNNNNEAINKTWKDMRCYLDVYLPDDRKSAVWTGDLCNENFESDIGLLTNQIKLVWRPLNKMVYMKERKLVLTAVGQGETCKNPGQHACLNIGFDPVWCISDYLFCDGVINCPKGSLLSDEDEKLCKNHKNLWEEFAVNMIKKFQPPSDILNVKWLHEKALESLNETQLIELQNKYDDLININTSLQFDKKTTKRQPPVSITTILSQYSPWGYILLGMLMCGVVLLVCGLWECCFRKPKEETEIMHPAAIILTQSSQDLTNNLSPPQYDDLEQPPSYNTLFPNIKLNRQETTNDVCVINIQECAMRESEITEGEDRGIVNVVEQTTS